MILVSAKVSTLFLIKNDVGHMLDIFQSKANVKGLTYIIVKRKMQS